MATAVRAREAAVRAAGAIGTFRPLDLAGVDPVGAGGTVDIEIRTCDLRAVATAIRQAVTVAVAARTVDGGRGGEDGGTRFLTFGPAFPAFLTIDVVGRLHRLLATLRPGRERYVCGRRKQQSHHQTLHGLSPTLGRPDAGVDTSAIRTGY
ncbi:hypothetical protein [uncultured Sphingomonas sp.]|uniref:hypothetical protein n=1 Tax=uncultured Sphingomonas sp. TaxID=158754 RepID=UPI0035C98461